MSVRPLQFLTALLLLLGPLPAAAQPAGPHTDVLTGAPTSRPPDIVNAPHAPRQKPTGAGEDPPIDILVAPQIGTPLPSGPAYRRY